MKDGHSAPVKVRAMVVDFGLTLKVDVCAAPTWRWRCTLGIALLRLAARVIGVGLDVRLLARHRHVRNSVVEVGLPRHLSSYDPDARSYGLLSIKLDGEVQDQATAYDADAGTITRPRCDATGKIMLDDDYILFETLEGRVEVARLTAS